MNKAATTVYSRLKNVFTNKSASTITAVAKNSTTSNTTTASRTISSKTSNKSFPMEEEKLDDLVKKFKESSESSSFRTRHNHYVSTVRHLASRQKYSMVEDILEHQKKFDDITSEKFVVRLMLLYSFAGMFDHALKLFDEMPQLKCERSIWSFNALLTSCVNAKKYDKVEDLSKQVSEKLGIKMNVISYSIVIKAFCQMNELDKALLKLDELEKNGLEPDLITYNTLLEAFYKNGRLSEGNNIWSLMITKYDPDIWSYNSKLLGLIIDNKLSEAVNMIEEMQNNKIKPIKPSLFTFKALIGEYIKVDNLEETKKWYGELAKNNLLPDKAAYNMLIPFLCEKGDVDMAIRLCKEGMRRRKIPGPSLYKVKIDELVEGSDGDERLKLLELANLGFKRG